MVDPASTMEERVSPFRSIETSGSSDHAQDSVQPPRRRGAQCLGDVPSADLPLKVGDKLNDGNGGHGHAVGRPVHAAVQFRDCQTDGAAAPVLAGTMLIALARASRRSLMAVSTKLCEDVYAWIVDISPLRTPNSRCTTSSGGARPLVVQEALLTT